jgi:hypothetical protein
MIGIVGHQIAAISTLIRWDAILPLGTVEFRQKEAPRREAARAGVMMIFGLFLRIGITASRSIIVYGTATRSAARTRRPPA